MKKARRASGETEAEGWGLRAGACMDEAVRLMAMGAPTTIGRGGFSRASTTVCSAVQFKVMHYSCSILVTVFGDYP